MEANVSIYLAAATAVNVNQDTLEKTAKPVSIQHIITDESSTSTHLAGLNL
jgi:hypothetical protein